MKRQGSFRKGDERAREAGRKGGEARAKLLKAARGAPLPFEGTILDAMDAAGMREPSWDGWRVFWRGVYALPMSETDLETFRRHTGRERPPAAPVSEAWIVAGRRCGKTRNAALGAFYAAISRDFRELLAPGEVAIIPLLAGDRRQARQALNYVRGLAHLPVFAPYIKRTLKESLALVTSALLEVKTADYRSIRGFSCPAIVADEAAFLQVDSDAASPDVEVIGALRPSQAAFKGALLLGLSTPHMKRGILYSTFEKFYGRDDPRTLVWLSDTGSMNGTIAAQTISDAFEFDEVWAASEYGRDGVVSFRADLESFLSAEAVAAATVAGRLELPPAEGCNYVGFCDPAGGSGADSFTLAVAHHQDGRAVLDCVREVRPKFSPEQVVQEFAEVLRSYGLATVRGDRYASGWPPEAFARVGITYEVSELTKAELYLQLLPAINAGRVELLDHQRLCRQLLGLERRTHWGGRQSVDHAPRVGHDDVCNSAAGAIHAALRADTGGDLAYVGGEVWSFAAGGPAPRRTA